MKQPWGGPKRSAGIPVLLTITVACGGQRSNDIRLKR